MCSTPLCQKKFFIRYIIQKFSLDYLEEEKEGNLCYAQAHDEIRPAFRTVFTARDVELYFRNVGEAVVSGDFNTFLFWSAEGEMFLPKNEGIFWKITEL